MKRKKIEAITPKPTKEKGLRATLQTFEDVLILNIYRDKKFWMRYCIDSKTGEHEVWKPEEGWKKQRLPTAIKGHWEDWYWNMDEYPKLTKEDDEAIKKKVKTGYCYKSGAWYELRRLAEDYDRETRWDAQERREKRMKEFMAKVQEEPEDLREWLFKMTGGYDYIFRERGTKNYFCTHCRSHLQESDLKQIKENKRITHNAVVRCPECGMLLTMKTRTNQIKERVGSCYIVDRIDETASVLRIFNAEIEWDLLGHGVRTEEVARIVMYKLNVKRRTRKVCKVLYPGWDCWQKENPCNYRAREGYIYPGDYREILKDTAYEDAIRILEYLSKTQTKRTKINYNRLFSGTAMIKGYTQKLEYLAKGGFRELLKDTVRCTEYPGYQLNYYGPLNLKANSIEGMFQISDRQKINRIRDEQGGNDIVRWMQWSEKTGKKMPREALRWLVGNDIRPSEIQRIEKYMNPQQIVNYLIRQQKEQYPMFEIKAVLQEYNDYLYMCENNKKDMSDAMVYRPRELKRRHDEIVADIQQIQILKEMQNRRKWESEFAQKMQEKYPTAQKTLQEIKERYEYENEEYKIIVPEALLDIVREGQALHHCAGSSERYFDRIEARETYICFLRRQSAPNIPYYTIEVEPGGTIRQHRSYLDEEPGIEEIREFLKEWQRELKKRLTKQDKELAKASKIKREANIEELKAKNNTRVLQGLAEDFLEAEEAV